MATVKEKKPAILPLKSDLVPLFPLFWDTQGILSLFVGFLSYVLHVDFKARQQQHQYQAPPLAHNLVKDCGKKVSFYLHVLVFQCTMHIAKSDHGSTSDKDVIVQQLRTEMRNISAANDKEDESHYSEEEEPAPAPKRCNVEEDDAFDVLFGK